MRVIALEEHFKHPEIKAANVNNPLETMYQDLAAAGFLELRGAGGPAPAGPDWPPGIDDLDAMRIADMDAGGIDMQVLSHTVPAVEGLPTAQAIELAVLANDALARAVGRHPTRFAGFATLPVGEPDHAAQELRRAVSEFGFVGAMVNGHANERYLDHESFWPIFETAEDLRVPIYLHPNRPPRAVFEASYTGFTPAVSAVLASGGWGWHVETGLHALRLILGGVFDRFPRLQLILGHLGEGLPTMLWRVDAMLSSISGLDRPIREYYEANFYITPSGVLDPTLFRAVRHTIGIDRIMFSVDYPYMRNQASREFLDRLELSQEDREKIAHQNAERLLGL